jgi:hypothetical protein
MIDFYLILAGFVLGLAWILAKRIFLKNGGGKFEMLFIFLFLVVGYLASIAFCVATGGGSIDVAFMSLFYWGTHAVLYAAFWTGIYLVRRRRK